MPWKDKTVENEREEFVRRALSREKSKSALCREYGISRPTGDKWIKRYQNDGLTTDKSRRPFHSPNRITDELEQKIVMARREEPAIGAMKLKHMLERKGHIMPAMSTINKVLKRNGLVTKEASLAATPYKRFEKAEPNEMWQLDFKGNFLMQDGARCHPLSVIDDCSRYCLNGDAMTNEQFQGTKDSLIRTFEAFGLPFSILCDNGTPWGASQSTSITRFEVWLMELGVLTTHIRPKRPQTQGKVERFNGSFKRERLKFYTPKDIVDAQMFREEYLNFYNNIRPHAGIDYEVPAKRYRPSSRAYPSKISAWEYPCETQVRQVKSTGYLTFGGQGFYLSEGLGNKQVALAPAQDDGAFNILFRQFRVAKLCLNTKTISSRRVYLLQDDPRQKV